MEVAIETDRAFAWTNAAIKSYVEPFVTLPQWSIFNDEANGYRAVLKHRMGGVSEWEDGRMAFPYAVLPQVVKQLRRAGHDVRIDDVWERIPPLGVDHSLMKVASPWERRLLSVAQSGPRVLVTHGSRDDLVRAVLTLVRYIVDHPLLIVVARREQVGRLYTALRPYLGERVRTSQNNTWDRDTALITTYRDARNAKAEDFDVVIFPDACEARMNTNRSLFHGFVNRRQIGFLSEHARVHEHRALQLKLWLGAPVLNVTDHTEQPKVSVHWCDPPWSPVMPAGTALALKQNEIWHNVERNRRIADVALAVVHGDMNALWSTGLFLGQDALPWPSVATLRVHVLVESTAHGRELQKLLPEFRLSAGGTRIVSSAGQRSQNLIITLVQADSLPHLDADVLIHAGAGEWICPVPIAGAQGQAVVIDVADEGDLHAKKTSRHRKKLYEARGWTRHYGPLWLRASDANFDAMHDGHDVPMVLDERASEPRAEYFITAP